MPKVEYQISADVEITPNYISRAIMDYSTRTVPRLNNLWNYYIGKQKILKKKPVDIGRPCNTLVTNYCNSIVKSYKGYLTGVKIKYTNDNFEDIIRVLNYNDTATEDGEFLKQALIFGKAVEICYIDEDGQQRFRLLDPRECVPVYANNLNNDLLYVIRFYKEDLLENQQEAYWVEVYGKDWKRVYKSCPGWTTVNLVEEVPNYYNQCPITIFSLNEEEESIFAQVISLQDAYNTISSDVTDDVESWASAYLVLKGVIADRDDLAEMKQNKALMIDTDASVEYLTKDINNEQVEYMLKTLDEQIHNISHTPNLLDEKFLSQSGVALKMKLVGFETEAASIEINMRKALQKRIELLCSILSMTDDNPMWRDVNITFTRNLPADVANDVQVINNLRGLVSDRTLLSQIPFVKDVDEELKQIAEQKENNAEIYGLNFTRTTDSEGNE